MHLCYNLTRERKIQMTRRCLLSPQHIKFNMSSYNSLYAFRMKLTGLVHFSYEAYRSCTLFVWSLPVKKVNTDLFSFSVNTYDSCFFFRNVWYPLIELSTKFQICIFASNVIKLQNFIAYVAHPPFVDPASMKLSLQ